MFIVGSVLTLGDAKVRFLEIVEEAAKGEGFVVTRMGKPVVRIVRVETPGRPHRPGGLTGRIRMSEDFDDWPPELQEASGMAAPR